MAKPASELRIEAARAVRLAWWAAKYYVSGYHRLQIIGKCPVPATGPVLLVCNHISGLDPVLLQVACPRVIAWMMAREYYETSAMRWFYELLGAIPVDRGGRDMAATRAALRALDDGRVLGVFPEGRISRELEMLPFQTGVALLAGRSGAQVVPACVDGTVRGREMTDAFLYPAEVRLAFGDPLTAVGVSGRDALEALTARIRGSIQGLQRTLEAIARKGG